MVVPPVAAILPAGQTHSRATLTTDPRSVMALTPVIETAAGEVNGEYARCAREEDGCDQRHQAAHCRGVCVHRSAPGAGPWSCARGFES